MTITHRRTRPPAVPVPLRVEVVRRVGRRLVQVQVPAGEVVLVALGLERHGDLVAARETRRPVRGRRLVRLRVPRWVLAGPAEVEVTLRDPSGGSRTERVRVHVPAR
jgi:hypothetical protein